MKTNTVILIFFFFIILGCQKSEKKQCPFDHLVLMEIEKNREDLFLKFSSEFDLRVKAILGNLFNADTHMIFKNTMDNYHSTVFGSDSIFVLLYNARVDLVCYRWNRYTENGEAGDYEELEKVIRELQLFVDRYYASNGPIPPLYIVIKTRIDLLNEINRYREQIAKDFKISPIKKEELVNKLEFMLARLLPMKEDMINENDILIIFDFKQKIRDIIDLYYKQ